MKVIILILSIFLFSCNENIKVGKIKFESSAIKFAEIKKTLGDSISVELSANEIKKIETKIDFDKEANLLKAGPKYWLVIKLKNDSVKRYKITNGMFGENDKYLELKDESYFNNLYQTGLKNRSKIPIEY